MSRRHLIYYRVSTRSQETASQRNALIAKIATLTEPYEEIEDKASGGNTDREGYQKMLSAVQQGQVISIICWRCDRIGRNCIENLRLAEACKARSTDICGVGDGLKLLSPNGGLIIGILSSIAEYEREKISENTREGVLMAKKLGKIVGGGFRGYTKDCVIALVPDILRMRSEKQTLVEICKKLRIDRKTLSRVCKDLAAGVPLRSRAEMLKEIPHEKRGKKFLAALLMKA